MVTRNGVDRRGALKVLAGGAVAVMTWRPTLTVGATGAEVNLFAATVSGGQLLGLTADDDGSHSVHALSIDAGVVTPTGPVFDAPGELTPIGFSTRTDIPTLLGAAVVHTPAPPLPPDPGDGLPEVSPPYGLPQSDELRVRPAWWPRGGGVRSVDDTSGLVTARWEPTGSTLLLTPPDPEGDHLNRVAVRSDDGSTETVATDVDLIGTGVIAADSASLTVAVDTPDGLRIWQRDPDGWNETQPLADAMPASATTDSGGRIHARRSSGAASAPATFDADRWQPVDETTDPTSAAALPVTGTDRATWLVPDGDSWRLSEAED